MQRFHPFDLNVLHRDVRAALLPDAAGDAAAADSGSGLVPELPLTPRDEGVFWLTNIDMDPNAASLVDIHFKNQNEGWVVGSRDTVNHPDPDPVRGDIIPAVLKTTDGGATWVDKTADFEHLFPQGEWCWKIQFIDDLTIVVSNQNYRDGAILRSEDGGETWSLLRINGRQRNSNLEGIGFLDEHRGWVGGWGDLEYRGGYTSASSDGGENWTDANDVGFRLNRFRFVGTPPKVIHASGDTVYTFSAEPFDEVAAEQDAAAAARDFEGWDTVEIPVSVPAGTNHLSVRIWDRFGEFVRLLADETPPTAGDRSLSWDFTDSDGHEQPRGAYILRVTLDDRSQSFMVYRR